jgi:mannose/cellobiose epimerase-like protein (N-acyl-D-glucosamine 2-epimerase family)
MQFGTLLDDILPFWQRHSPDREHGGCFNLPELRRERLRHRQLHLAASPPGVDVFHVAHVA